MHHVNLPIASMMITILAACGSRTDAGSGSKSLFTLIEVVGKPDSTSIEVELKLRGNPVADANIVVEDLDTNAESTLEGHAGGIYKTTLNRYARALSVMITSGDDKLEATLEGPSPHVITRPPNNSIVRRADFEVLKVEWEAEDPAERVEVEPEGVDVIPVEGDAYEASVPLGPLRSREQKLGVSRETSVLLEGGTAGSKMRSRYKVDNRFTLEG